MIKRNLRSSYDKYAKSVENAVSVSTYIKLNAEYNKFLISKVLDGNKITLPSRMGTLAIEGKKQSISYDENGNIKGLAPDWVKTKKLWDENPKAKKEKKLLYHMNDHTDNIRYKFVWSKFKVLVLNKTLYSLRLTRTNKRAVHQAIKQGERYFVKN